MWLDKETWLTYKQKAFADTYLKLWGNWTQAIMQIYNPKNYNVAWAMATENLNKPKIKAYLSDKWDIAGNIIMTLAQDKTVKSSVRLDASKFVYEQVYGKASQKVEHNMSWTISLAGLYSKASPTSLTAKNTTQASQIDLIIDASADAYADE